MTMITGVSEKECVQMPSIPWLAICFAIPVLLMIILLILQRKTKLPAAINIAGSAAEVVLLIYARRLAGPEMLLTSAFYAVFGCLVVSMMLSVLILFGVIKRKADSKEEAA